MSGFKVADRVVVRGWTTADQHPGVIAKVTEEGIWVRFDEDPPPVPFMWDDDGVPFHADTGRVRSALLAEEPSDD